MVVDLFICRQKFLINWIGIYERCLHQVGRVSIWANPSKCNANVMLSTLLWYREYWRYGYVCCPSKICGCNVDYVGDVDDGFSKKYCRIVGPKKSHAGMLTVNNFLCWCKIVGPKNLHSVMLTMLKKKKMYTWCWRCGQWWQILKQMQIFWLDKFTCCNVDYIKSWASVCVLDD